jgi:hypothetical protein
MQTLCKTRLATRLGSFFGQMHVSSATAHFIRYLETSQHTHRTPHTTCHTHRTLHTSHTTHHTRILLSYQRRYQQRNGCPRRHCRKRKVLNCSFSVILVRLLPAKRFQKTAHQTTHRTPCLSRPDCHVLLATASATRALTRDFSAWAAAPPKARGSKECLGA